MHLIDVNEPPEFVAGRAIELQYPEGAYDGVVLASLPAVDQDRDEVLVYRVVEGDGTFEVDPDTGDLRLVGPLDYEQQQVHDVLLEVQDREGLTDTLAVRVQVSDADSFPQRYTLTYSVRDAPIQAPGDPCWIRGLDVDEELTREQGHDPVTIPNPFDPTGSVVVIDYYGSGTIRFASVPDGGALNATVVTEVEIIPGQVLEVPAAVRPVRTAIDGRSPGYGVLASLIVRDSRMAAYRCSPAALALEPVDYDAECQLLGESVIDLDDPLGLPSVHRMERTAEAIPYAVVSDADDPSHVETRMREGLFELRYPFLSWFEWAAAKSGAPTFNRIFTGYRFGPYLTDIATVLVDFGATVRNAYRTRVALRQRGVHARLTLEDGSVVETSIPTCRELGRIVYDECLLIPAQIRPDCPTERRSAREDCDAGDGFTFELPVPEDADLDGDGLVSVTAEFELWKDLDRNFFQNWVVGGYFALGRAVFTVRNVMDPEDPERTSEEAGPFLNLSLAADVDLECPTESRVEFPTQTRRGAVDLVTP